MLLADLVRFDLNTVDAEEALKADGERQFRTPTINKGAEVEERRLRQFSVGQSSSANRLFMHNLVSNAGRLVYSIQRPEVDTRI